MPGNSVAATFAGRPPVQREIYDAIAGYLRGLGPLHVDAVTVGVFLKNESKLAEVRPMVRGVKLLLFLPYPASSPRIGRRETVGADRIMHPITLTSLSDVDDELRNWLGQAYDAAS